MAFANGLNSGGSSNFWGWLTAATMALPSQLKQNHDYADGVSLIGIPQLLRVLHPVDLSLLAQYLFGLGKLQKFRQVAAIALIPLAPTCATASAVVWRLVSSIPSASSLHNCCFPQSSQTLDYYHQLKKPSLSIDAALPAFTYPNSRYLRRYLIRSGCYR